MPRPPRSIPPDRLWKAYLEDNCEDVLRYRYPDWSGTAVDWSRGIEFLEQELHSLFPESEQKEGRVDKLLKLYLKDGAEQWVLLHIEVQGYYDADFSERMFRYYYRIWERYGQRLATLVILTTPEASRLPAFHEQAFLRTRLRYEYDVLDIAGTAVESLDQAGNPFSLVLLAAKSASDKHLCTDAAQLAWKLDLMRRLLRGGYDKSRIRSIFHFVSYCVDFAQPSLKRDYEAGIKIMLDKKEEPMGMKELIEEHIRLVQEDLKADLAEARSEAEELRQAAEELRRREEEARRREEETRRAADELRRREEETRHAADELRRREEATLRKAIQGFKAKGFSAEVVADILERDLAEVLAYWGE